MRKRVNKIKTMTVFSSPPEITKMTPNGIIINVLFMILNNYSELMTQYPITQ